MMEIMFLNVALLILSGLILNVYFSSFFIFTPFLNNLILMHVSIFIFQFCSKNVNAGHIVKQN
jgi:hypothetical protein